MRKFLLLWAVVAMGAVFAHAATFGKVIPIGGHVADIALDEPRGRLYAANFTANRIEVISTTDGSRLAPMIVPPQPGSLALSPDGRYLVIGHYAIWTPGCSLLAGSVTILNLETGILQNFPRPGSPLAIAFGAGNHALIAYNNAFELLDPATGTFTPKQFTIDPLALPVDFNTFPPNILQASAGVSGDGQVIYLLTEASQLSSIFRYNITDQTLTLIRGFSVTSDPVMGPVAVSVDGNGSNFLAAWALFNSDPVLMAQFPRPTGELHVGSHAFDYSRNLIYAHIPVQAGPQAGTSGPCPVPPDKITIGVPPPPGPIGSSPFPQFDRILSIVDSDNLTVREQIQLPERLAGKSLLSSDFRVMYSASDSGVTILPIGSLDRAHRVVALQEDVVFAANACDVGVIAREIDIVNPGGGNTAFALSTSALGVRIFPDSGTTPARVRIEVDPTVYQTQRGTTAVFVNVRSADAVNVPMPVRLLINTREPDQRGTLVNIPGKLMDILADPVRDRFYVLRQDRNLVLIFDGTTFEQIGSLRTGNTPVQMAMTMDGSHLIVTNDNSQIANVYDLDLLQADRFIRFPNGHYPRSIAVSNNAILVGARSIFPSPAQIDRIDFSNRRADALLTLGIFRNVIHEETMLAVSPSGEYIFISMPDGTLVLYEAAADTFVASRKDFGALSGAAAVWTDRLFAADDKVVNWSLVPIAQLETQTGSTAGLIFFEGFGLRTTSPGAAAPGVIQRVDLAAFQSIRPTRMAESPLRSTSLRTPPIGQIGQTILPFLRTLAPLANRVSIVSLTTSGLTVLPWDFEAVPPIPTVTEIVNLADGAPGIAPGGWVAIFGTDFSSATAAAAGLPLPTTLGELCLTVNNVAVPLWIVSPNRIAAQLPFNVVGSASLVARALGGFSRPFPFTILPGAPAVFRTATAGPLTGLPNIFRAVNNEPVTLSNPVHPEDELTILLTGLGVTSPAVGNGAASPADPLAAAILTPQVTLGGVPLPIAFAGLAPGYAGLYQINALVPGSVPAGLEIPLTIQQGFYSTTLPVRVVK